MKTAAWTVVCASLALSGCFEAPPAQEDTEDDGTGDTGATGTGVADDAPPPTSDGPDSGDATGSGDATSGPTTGVDTTATSNVDDATTATTGPDCKDDGDCDAGMFCIEGACGTCADGDDPDALCSGADGALPVCDVDGGTCVACVAATCDGDNPVCDPTVGCLPCVEHFQCPDSACHLLGPEQGSCFDTADVVEASDVTELTNALTGLSAGAQLVINLAAETFTMSGTLSINGEVAILGQPGTIVTGGATNVFAVGGMANELLYLAGIEFDTGPFRVVRCDAPGGVWIDDTSIVGYPVAVLSLCDAHVRRSHFNAAMTGGVALAVEPGGSLQAENSSIGPGTPSAITVFGGDVDLRYMTIAGNETSLDCDSMASGTVRNSILTGTVATGSISSSCFLSFVDNAVDEGFSLGDEVGVYDGNWFTAPAQGDFHLAMPGAAVFADIADWDDGDPLADIDGDPRPQMAPGFVGLDEVP